MSRHDTRESTAGKAEAAPSPDDSRKPSRPQDVTKPSWRYIARKTLREFMNDQCTDLAAGLTYYGMLSLFPALLAIVSVLGLFGQAENTVSGMMNIVQSVAPGTTTDAIRQPIEDLVHNPAAGLTLVIGLLGAVWSASGYVRAFGRAMNRIYEIGEGRSFVRLRGTTLAVTLLSVVIAAVIAAILVLSGPVAESVGNAVGLGGATVLVWDIVKWPVAVALVIGLIAVLYYFTPNVRQPKFRWMSMGSFIALVIFALATLAFGFYVGNFGHYNKTYGTLGGVIIMLLWVWLLNLSLLFGAEFDAEVERGRELQAGIPAEKSIQLPPKSTEKTEKREEQAEKDIHHGRELRRHHGKDAPEATERAEQPYN
ncbi:YihY/virulence factor BrkB family protein [Sinomonas susongensis]|uniref:YihY/virulence factor BrkB family protein n=1 Tax=Sinomonas susongensis TaxID=1324851 RepID=UPI0011094425|nr:YihY/virulence factor BrkB family protein [Sinomonas susongensis]